MLLRDLTKVWVSEYETVNNRGEKSKNWKFRPINSKQKYAYLNLQQDINELDRKPTGEVDYSVEKARTDIEYDIQKGNGISLTDISNRESFVPDYIVTDKIKIGKTTLYNLEKNNGN